MVKDTIAAIATALTNSGIGIVRISGEEAIEIADKIYRGKKSLKEAESHTVHYGHIVEKEEVIDEVMVLVLKAPNTYTRENTVEIDCHGGVLVMKRILNTILKYGARLAEPGEFTKRAFLNGRIDLAEAEAVIGVINAQNNYALQASLGQLNGKVSKKVKKLREDILYQIAFIESALDDPENISLEDYPQEGLKLVDSLLNQLDDLLRSAENGKVITEGIKTVILGKPNVGKSSLLNTLAGEDRAIVTDIAGTTRDILTEHILLGGISLNLVDTAGIRETQDIVEQIGVEKARTIAADADLIIYVADASMELDENDREIIEYIKDKKAIVLLNKTDLPMVITKEELENNVEKPVILISAKEGNGIEKLEESIKQMFLNREVSANGEICITNIRHKQALQEAYNSICLVKQSMLDGMAEDFYTIDFMEAYEQLGYIIGEALEDDLVNEIFQKFCMGK